MIQNSRINGKLKRVVDAENTTLKVYLNGLMRAIRNCKRVGVDENLTRKKWTYILYMKKESCKAN